LRTITGQKFRLTPDCHLFLVESRGYKNTFSDHDFAPVPKFMKPDLVSC